jgi:hypothetical protein
MTKKKNSLNKNTSIIVKFIDCTDDEIDESLKSINLSGVRVSNLINRWAIEVPFWKEQYYTEQLKKLDLIDTVHTSLNSAANRYYRKEEVVDDEN